MMRRLSYPFPILAVLALWGCDSNPAPDATEAPAAPLAPRAAARPVQPVEPDDPTILRRPFTAEQIRDEWAQGLMLVMATRSADGMTLERWSVVVADDDGADIEVVPIDTEGNATGEPRVGRSSWVELRDHANFPADVATREDVVRETPLGELDGWLYRVPDPAAGTVSELFFARSLPGAPVEMRITRDGEPFMELAQIERRRPDQQ